MNALKTALKSLCANDGISSAVIITREGMVIESRLEDTFNEETVAAFMSQVALTITNFLASAGEKEFTKYIIFSGELKIYVLDLGKSVLVAITQIGSETADINVALFQAANEIKKTERLNV